MYWKDCCLSFVKKYGKAAKVVAGGVLNVVAPGSGTLLALVEQACDNAIETAQDHWEESLLKATQNNTAELQHLGQLFELLNGDLARLCDKALAFADQPDDLPDIIGRAIAADPSLSRVLHHVEAIKGQFTVFQADLRQIARHQQDVMPVYERMNRVADYFDELWQAGIKPKDFAQQLHRRQEAVAGIERGDTGDLDNVLLEMRTVAPKAASVCILEAAAATRDFDYPAAQRALTSAIKLRPGDAELVELSRRVTVLATARHTEGPCGSGGFTTATSATRRPSGRLAAGSAAWRGRLGQVFKATRDGQTKAIKVMHRELAADRAFVERFNKEIASLLRLPRHPNLVGIEPETAFGYCNIRQTRYLAMEHIDGPTLEGYLAGKGPLTEAQVRKVFPDAIAGLAKAHAAGIVHRDIKPGNLIFRRKDSRLVFVDFGLAVGVEEFGQTKVGGLSVLFAAPEQHYGEPATQASDVFSLCAVIHYALNYDKPDLRKPNRFSPGLIPDSPRGALAKGMLTNTAERFRDAGQLLDALPPRDSVVVEPAKPIGPPTDPVGTAAEGQRKKPSQGKIGATITNRLGMRFAWVPPGESWLGGGGGKVSTQQFTVEQALWCGVYPVTQAEWQVVMGNNPSQFKDNPRDPVETVSWNEVQKFIEQLNQRTHADGLLYRLPTEEQWEYICRGGPLAQNQSNYYFSFARSKTDLTSNPSNDLSSTQANFDGNYPAGSAAKGPYLQHPCDVGSYLPNSLGIYDLHGNVWEWTSSVQGSDRVLRGGSWYHRSVRCTASYRYVSDPDSASSHLGFRLLAVPSR